MADLSIRGTALRGAAQSAYQKRQQSASRQTNSIYAQSNTSTQSTQGNMISSVLQGLSQNISSRKTDYSQDTYVGPANMRFTQSVLTKSSSKTDATGPKKLKYSFKKISSQIRAAKTSMTAKSVVSKAKREVSGLKKKRGSEKYDQDELEMAISHALAMERVAKKKEKNLETEELAKRGVDSAVAALDPSALEEAASSFEENFHERTTLMEGIDEEFMGELDQEFLEDMDEEFSEFLSDPEQIEAFISDMEELMKEDAEALQEFAEGELMDMAMDLIAYSDGLDEEDIEKMENRHRSSEDREITKADMRYLKEYLEYLQEKMESGGDAVLNGNSQGIQGVITSIGSTYTPTAELVNIAEATPSEVSITL